MRTIEIDLPENHLFKIICLNGDEYEIAKFLESVDFMLRNK